MRITLIVTITLTVVFILIDSISALIALSTIVN